MTLGPVTIYIPICPEHHVGGPVGYRRVELPCPIVATRKPPQPHEVKHGSRTRI